GVTIDERGAVRGASTGPGSMANAGTTPDIGAWEASSLNIVTANFIGGLVGDSSNIGTLREAIEWANNSSNPLVSNTTPNVVMFDATVFATPQTITLSLGTLTLSNTSVGVMISGPAVSGPIALTVSGTRGYTVLRVNSSVTGTVSGLTITGGYNFNGAGGIDNGGMLSLKDVAISNNYGFLGGGILNDSGANLTITNSTISGNNASVGAGIGNIGTGTAIVQNSTITGNTAFASGGGGGIYNFGGTLRLFNTTLANNMGGGGLINNGGTLFTKNAIISGNVGGDISGNIGSQGHNLIRNPTGGSGFALSDIFNLDPLLLPLANNSGPTQTMALGFGSPAIDQGDNTGAPATDQRDTGFARIINGIIDIGAFEDQLVSSAPTSPQVALEGSAQSFSLGSFSDAQPGVSSWSSTIRWGDGNTTSLALTSTGMIPGQTHTYAEEGSYTATVQIADALGDTQQKTFTVGVSDPIVIASGGYSVTAAQGSLSATQTVATYTDPAGAEANDGTHYSASINWGDSTTPSTGTISFANGVFTVSGNHTYAAGGSYSITVTINHELALPTMVTDTATVSNSGLSAMAVNISPTAGAPFTGTVATFTDPSGPGPISSYSASIAWGDNSGAVAGTITLSGGVFTVTASHTYAAAASDTMTITLSRQGMPTTVQGTAMVSSLGQFVQAGLIKPISFWAGLQGQELVRRFGLTSAGQTLGQWLATTFPNLYGGANGPPNLSPFTNAQISSYYQSLYLVSKGTGLDAEVLATTLEVFTTTLSLGGTTGQANGFTVNSNGLGAYSWNIGASGQAFGVSNNTVLDVYQILLTANNTASGGEPWSNNTLFRNEAYSVFHGINGG
ncbi:MAG TPA: choice-of-anchor Q domain-containing protein, partial [Gemmataceae bacterium]|nr:choice-of-anchor Q domain-containing protein [Gemmataceae bacterium]